MLNNSAIKTHPTGILIAYSKGQVIDYRHRKGWTLASLFTAGPALTSATL